MPLERGRQYKLIVHWRDTSATTRPVSADVVLRFKPTLNPVLVPSVSPAIVRPASDYTFTASADRDAWAQIFVRTPGELRAVIDAVDVVAVAGDAAEK